MVDQEIKEQAFTFVFAVQETTGNLMIDEEVLKTCCDEVDRIFSDGVKPTYKQINESIVCEGVIQETFREHSIGSEGHQQIHVPVGAVISVSTYIPRWLRDLITDLKPKF
jgi:hypothetical protein